jgi:hypothetical protein
MASLQIGNRQLEIGNVFGRFAPVLIRVPETNPFPRT